LAVWPELHSQTSAIHDHQGTGTRDSSAMPRPKTARLAKPPPSLLAGHRTAD
jgi:hypothetical protein